MICFIGLPVELGEMLDKTSGTRCSSSSYLQAESMLLVGEVLDWDSGTVFHSVFVDPL